MTDLQTVMADLAAKSDPGALKIFRNLGYQGEAFGVRIGELKKMVKTVKKDQQLVRDFIGELKKMVKTVKKDQQLVRDLFATGNADAQYLAGLAADPAGFSAAELDAWAAAAHWFWVSEYAVAGVAAESSLGWTAALRWLEDERDHVAAAGWATLTHMMSITSDEALDLDHLRALLTRVADTIHDCQNRTRYAMNGFVMAAAAFVAPLLAEAKAVAATIGKVDVDMGGSACKVHLASDYIKKLEAKNRIGKKKKTARC